MSLTKHTPGPWISEPYGTHRAIVYQEGAQAYAPDFACEIEGDGFLDNARLIAAAPELLAACEAALAVAARMQDPSWANFTEAEDLIRAAIAKAKGDKP